MQKLIAWDMSFARVPFLFKIWMPIFFFISLSSCRNAGERRESVHNNQIINNDVVGKKILFPHWLYPIDKNQITFKNDKPIILTVLSIDCGKCIDKLISWDNFDNVKNLEAYNIVFVTMGKRTPLFDRYLAQRNSLRFTIYVDTTETFLRENNIYNYYQKTLVLNKEKKAIYVGDPVNDKLALKDFIFLANDYN